MPGFRVVKDTVASCGESASLLRRSGLGWVDPYFHGTRRRLGPARGEALRMPGVRGGEHSGSRCGALLGLTVMHVKRCQQSKARMMVLGVVPREEAGQCARASWIEPKRVGNAGRYF